MYNQPFFIPRYGINTIPFNTTGTQVINNIGKNPGIFSKFTGLFEGFKTINWSNIINNTSKTLGIVNQTIPLVRQVGPMFGNMKSMLKLASAFKDETDIKNTSIPKSVICNNDSNSSKITNYNTNKNKENIFENNNLTFFVNS